MCIFITGATGFVGQNLVAFLQRQVPDAHLLCLVRDPQKAEPLRGPKVTLIPGDLQQPETYQAAAQQAEVIFHIAAKVSLRNGSDFYAINTGGTQQLLQAAQENPQLQRVVFLSSIAAVDRPPGGEIPLAPLTETTCPAPTTDYGKSKLQAEEALGQSGLPFTILRPPYIYGPYPRKGSSVDRLLSDVLHQKRYTRFPFPGRVSEIYVEDLAEAMWVSSQAKAAENETFFIANPEPVGIADAFHLIAQALQVEHALLPYPPEQVERVQHWLYRRHPCDPVLRIFFEDYFLCSPRKFMEKVGYRPRHTLSEGVAKTLAWLRAHGQL